MVADQFRSPDGGSSGYAKLRWGRLARVEEEKMTAVEGGKEEDRRGESHIPIRPLLRPRGRVAKRASGRLEVLSIVHLVSSAFPSCPVTLHTPGSRSPGSLSCPSIAFHWKVQARAHGRRSVRRRDDRVRRQEPAARGRGRGAPQGASPCRARPAVLAAHHHQGRAPPRARDRHVLRAARHGAPGGPGPGCSGAGAGAGDGAGRGGQGRGGAAHRGEEGAEAVRASDVPGGRHDVQPRVHVHGRRRRVLSLQLANGGRRGAGERDVGHVRALRRRGGRDGVLGAVGAPGAVARLPVAHARVAPPAAGGPLRAQRRVRHHQRRAGHLSPRLRLLPPRPRARPMLRRGPRDYAVRHGIHVRPRRPGPPPLPGRPRRQRALLPPSGCRSQDTPHGQVRGRPVWALPGTKGAGGGWWPGRAGKGARANRPDHLMMGSSAFRRGELRCAKLRGFRFCSVLLSSLSVPDAWWSRRPEGADLDARALIFSCISNGLGGTVRTWRCPVPWNYFFFSFLLCCHCHVGVFVETSHVLVPLCCCFLWLGFCVYNL